MNNLCFKCIFSRIHCKYREENGTCAGCNWFLDCKACDMSDYDYESCCFHCLKKGVLNDYK